MRLQGLDDGIFIDGGLEKHRAKKVQRNLIMGKWTAGNYRIRQDADHFIPGYWLLIPKYNQMGFRPHALIKLKCTQYNAYIYGYNFQYKCAGAQYGFVMWREAIFVGLILIIAAYFGPSILILVWIKYRKHFNHHERLGPIVADGIL